MNIRAYQWLVVRGRIGVTRDSKHVVLEADPEGTAFCVRNAQDAREIAGIVAEHSRALWDASDKTPEPKASVEGGQRSYRLKSASGTLSVVANDAKPLIALSYDGTT